MTQKITIDPVTRIEGHARITIRLDDAGQVADAQFHVTEFRGFEKFCVGRTYPEMPGITMRICGICPVSHMLASAKACDAIMGVRVPPAAETLRRLVNHAQYVQSHALSFFFLSAPDLILGMESDPAGRNVAGLIDAYPELARKGIRLRRFGQDIIRMLGNQSVHPPWAVPGGVREGLTAEDVDGIARGLPEAFDITDTAIDLLLDRCDAYRQEIETYGNFPSLFIGLTTPEGGLEHYSGVLRVMDAEGRILEQGPPDDRWREIIAEAVQPFTYLKFPYYRPLGYGDGASDAPGLYRVGPLARLNLCDFAGPPQADRELRRFRRLGDHGMPVQSCFHAHYARLIEILFALEKIAEIIEDPRVHDPHLRSHAGVNQLTGTGVMEAPRGTLFHEYRVTDDGIIQKVDLLVATGNNTLAMNKTIAQIARAYITGPPVTEGVLNRIEHGIRLYDPCLSCATHAVGRMQMHIRVLDARGRVLEEKARE